jgi:hypothetical protein
MVEFTINTTVDFKHKLGLVRESAAYQAIAEVYKDKKAKRSGVAYMQHIDEGIAVLLALGANGTTMEAYCAHPLVQADEGLTENVGKLSQLPTMVAIMTMEYRNVANRGLSCYQTDDPAHIYLGPSKGVHWMLIADKVQNRKDFLRYHYGKHEKSAELDRYFRNWLRALNVTEADYEKLCKCMAQIHDDPEAEVRANHASQNGACSAVATSVAFWNQFVAEYAGRSSDAFMADVCHHVNAIQNALIAKQVADASPEQYSRGYLGTEN